jgi:hypothetical protein
MKSDEKMNVPHGITSHVLVAIAGFLTMLLGVGLSVTMVLLPVGIPLGLAGLGLLMWGLTPQWRK